MPDDLSATLKQWRKATLEATPGPWRIDEKHGTDIADEGWSEIRIKDAEGDDVAATFISHLLEPGNSAQDEEFIVTSRTAMPHLLAAAEAVLKLHQPKPLYGLAFAFNSDEPLCAHDPDSDHDAHFEGDDGLWYCQDKIKGQACISCAEEDAADMWAEWPCPTYLAIRTALGEETGDGR